MKAPRKKKMTKLATQARPVQMPKDLARSAGPNMADKVMAELKANHTPKMKRLA
jgi:hypothetical protein